MKPIFTAILFFGIALQVYAQKTYHFGISPKHTNITFSSETILETILGNVNLIEGTIVENGEKSIVNLKVPVSKMKTGIDLRDEHLRSPQWLNAEKNPFIQFESNQAKSLGNDLWEVTGNFTMNGVTKPITIKVQVTPLSADKAAVYGPGEWIRVKSEFKVKLSDHQVKIAKTAEGKVNDEWTVKVTIFGTTQPNIKK
ncbi:MAG: YceI family protein [bacterium]|nr:YceI family protein [bacterium]